MPSRKAAAGAGDGRNPAIRPACRRMQSPTPVVSRDRYDIESLPQKQPNGFKPALLNARSADSFVRVSRSNEETCGLGGPRSVMAWTAV